MMSMPSPGSQGHGQAPYYRFHQDGRPPEPVYPHPVLPAVAVSADPLVPTGFSGWLSRVMGTLRRSFAKLAILHLGLLVVQNLLLVGIATLFGQAGAGVSFDAPGGLTRDDSSNLSGYLLFSLGKEVVRVPVAVFASGASVYLVVREAAGLSARLGDSLRFAAGRFLPALGWTFLAAVMVLVGGVIFFLPGLYLAIVCSPLMGVLFVERGNLARCFALVNPRFLMTSGRITFNVIPGLVYLLFYFLVLKITNFGSGSPLAIVLDVLLGLPITLLAIAVLVVTYAELRGRERPGTSTQTLAAELTAR